MNCAHINDWSIREWKNWSAVATSELAPGCNQFAALDQEPRTADSGIFRMSSILLELPCLDSPEDTEESPLAARLAFWRAQEIRQATGLLQREFPTADVQNAMNFARVVVDPNEGIERLTQYVRGILHPKGGKLAAQGLGLQF